MIYLIDTNVVSDVVKGYQNTAKRLLSHSPHEIAMSSITVMEIEYGLSLIGKTKRELLQNKLNAFILSLGILNFNQKDALSAAQIRSFLKKKGKPIGAYDVLLAGQALNRNLIFVTSNTSEFSRIKDLKIENWREN